MRLVNLSVIDEHAQNEIQSINSGFQHSMQEEIKSAIDFTKIYNNYRHHIILAGYQRNTYEIQMTLRTELKRLNCSVQSHYASLVTMLTREPTHLMNRDYCNRFQQYGGNINGIEVRNSIGDDLEFLLQRTIATSDNFLTNCLTDWTDWFRNEDVYTYHFYEMSDDELMNLDPFENRLLRSLARYPSVQESAFECPLWLINGHEKVEMDNEWKYVLSLCNRNTILV